MTVFTTGGRAAAPLFTSAALAVAMLSPLSALATENGQVRALLGAPSYELATPQFPGWYGQLWVQRYSADKLRDNDGEAVTQTMTTPLGALQVTPDVRIRAEVLVPRLTYVSDIVVGEGRLGFSASLPLVHQTTDVTLNATLPAGLTAGQIAAANTLLAQQSALRSGSESGQADMEVASFIDWQQDESRLVAGLAVVVPTGDYDKDRVVNPGTGKYWTLRPLMVAARAWENGLEAGTRVTYSINSRNRDTDVRSGSYLHADWSGMYRADDNWKFGLQGYVLKQFTKDDGPNVAEHGNKAQTLGAGPVLAYLAQSGNWALDLKWMQEFAVRNRPEGQVTWVRLNMRLD
ncbi:SphA family protein [Sphaerotilaceae bacterium SBD11-9]